MNSGEAASEMPMEEDQRRASFGRIDHRGITVQQSGAHPGVYEPPAQVQTGSHGHIIQPSRLTPTPAPTLTPSQGAPTQAAPSPFIQNGQMGQQPPDNVVLLQTLHTMQQQMQQQQHIISQMLQQQQQIAPQSLLQPAQHQHAAPSNPELILDALANSITEFRYEAEAGVTFEAWFTRYEDLFAQDASRLGDEAKVRLLVRKLGTPEHARYTSYILPRSPRDLSFEETVNKLKALFGCRESLLSKRYKCLQITKKPTEDFITFCCRINRACVDFQLASMNEETFKCLLLVCGLKDEADNDLRTRLLARIEERNDVSLEQLSAECQRITSVKGDSAMIAGERSERVLAVYNGEKRTQEKAAQRTQYKRFTHRKRPYCAKDAESPSTSKPSKPCWLCSGMHWVRECTYSSHKCLDCGKYGHREGHCNVANKRRQGNFRRRNCNTRVVTVNVRSIRERRRFVSIALNGTAVRLQLDTADRDVRAPLRFSTLDKRVG